MCIGNATARVCTCAVYCMDRAPHSTIQQHITRVQHTARCPPSPYRKVLLHLRRKSVCVCARGCTAAPCGQVASRQTNRKTGQVPPFLDVPRASPASKKIDSTRASGWTKRRRRCVRPLGAGRLERRRSSDGFGPPPPLKAACSAFVRRLTSAPPPSWAYWHHKSLTSRQLSRYVSDWRCVPHTAKFIRTRWRPSTQPRPRCS